MILIGLKEKIKWKVLKNFFNMIEFIKEIYSFLTARKKYWLLPIFIFLIIFGGLIVLSQGSVVAPFIYTLF